MPRLRIDETGLPMRLRRVRVADDGTLLASQDRTTQHFHVTWRGETFAGRYRHDAEGARVRLAANVAALPYAAEAPRVYANLKRIVEAAREDLGPVMHITRDRRIVVGRRIVLDPPMTADSLMATLATVLLTVDPYLRLVQDYRAD